MNAEFERYLTAIAAWSGAEARVRRGTRNIEAARERGLRTSAEGAEQAHARVERLEQSIARNVADVRRAFARAGADALLADLVASAPAATAEVTEERLQAAFAEHKAAAEMAVAAAHLAADERTPAPTPGPTARRARRWVVPAVVAVIVVIAIVAVLTGLNT